VAAKTLQDFWNEKSTWQSTFDRDRALWKAATDAAVEKFTSTNNESMPCEIGVYDDPCKLGYPCKCKHGCLIKRTAYVS